MAYTSNIRAVTKRLAAKLKAIAKDDAIIREIATTLLASNVQRIHLQGLTVNGGQIGQYGTKPLYISVEASPKKFGAPTGKTGKSKFKSGKPHTSKYFSEGYAGFRSAIGADASKVNLTLTTRLQNDFQTQKRGRDWVLGFESSYGKRLRQAFEAKYGTRIWGVTQKDRKLSITIASNRIKAKLK